MIPIHRDVIPIDRAGRYAAPCGRVPVAPCFLPDRDRLVHLPRPESSRFRWRLTWLAGVCWALVAMLAG